METGKIEVKEFLKVADLNWSQKPEDIELDAKYEALKSGVEIQGDLGRAIKEVLNEGL